MTKINWRPNRADGPDKSNTITAKYNYMGYVERNNKVAQDFKKGLIPSINKAKERLEFLLNRQHYQIAYEEGLITFNKLQELKLAKKYNNSI